MADLRSWGSAARGKEAAPKRHARNAQHKREEPTGIASERGGIPLFNQTSGISREQATSAFGDRLGEFENERLRYDPRGRFLNAYFRELLSEGHFIVLAESADLTGPETVRWTNRLETEHDNLRVALAWSHERGDVEAALRLAGALARFWVYRNNPSEGFAWLQRVLAMPGTASGAVRAKAVSSLALMAINVGDVQTSLKRLQESITLSRQGGDRPTEIRALVNMGYPLLWKGDIDGAAAAVNEALVLARKTDDRRGEASSLVTLALVVGHQDIRRSIELLEQSLSIFRELGNPWQVARALADLGSRAHILGDYGRAEVLFQEALEHYRALGSPVNTASNLARLAELATIRGAFSRARPLFEESLSLYRQAGDQFFITSALTGLGWLNLCEGDLDRAAEQFGESLALARRGGDKGRIAVSLRCLGVAAIYRREHARAEALLEESLTVARGSRSPLSIADSLVALGTLARRRGNAAKAAVLLRDALEHRARFENRLGIVSCLEALAGVALDSARPGRAARLFGAAEATRETIGGSLPPVDRPGFERDLIDLRAAMPQAALQAAWAEGRAMTLDQAIEYALSEKA